MSRVSKREKQPGLLPVTKHWWKRKHNKEGYSWIVCYNCNSEKFDDGKVNKTVKCQICGYRGYEK